MRDLVEIILVMLYSLGAVGMAIYGLHAGWLAWLTLRNADRTGERTRAASGSPSKWPAVTVQLPIFNERHVVERLLDATAGLDYPLDKLQIQLLDDSIDDTVQISDAAVARLRRSGANVTIVRRHDRSGFKAGALAHALPAATGEFIVIFDADFLPPASFLKQILTPFLGNHAARLAFVQGRWAHLNRGYSLTTRSQALALDGHFGVEQPARAENGLPFGFNGSAGAWRRAAIEDPSVGGWQGDTLCEDLDLAYRAQLAGWSGAYEIEVGAPAELPPQLLAFKRQQARWATGSIQTLLKLGGRVFRSQWPVRARLAGLIHLGNYLIHPLLLLLLITSVPLILLDADPPSLLVGLSFASLGPPFLYALAEYRLSPDAWLRNWAVLPLLMLFGLGLAWNNSVAVWRAISSQGGDFARTPKFRIESAADRWQGSRYRLPLSGQMAVEAGLSLYALVGVAAAVRAAEGWTALFLALFALGFGAMVAVGMAQAWPRRRERRRLAPHRTEPLPALTPDQRAEAVGVRAASRKPLPPLS